MCELSDCGFKSRCCHLKFRCRACFEVGVPKYKIYFILSKTVKINVVLWIQVLIYKNNQHLNRLRDYVWFGKSKVLLNLSSYKYLIVTAMTFAAKHQCLINVETTLTVNVHQSSFNIDIWFRIKVEIIHFCILKERLPDITLYLIVSDIWWKDNNLRRWYESVCFHFLYMDQR